MGKSVDIDELSPQGLLLATGLVVVVPLTASRASNEEIRVRE